ncbi:MAG: DegV family protein [Oscillibacter sp.]|nr:DegV family protein [Oscillibacter sp.]
MSYVLSCESAADLTREQFLRRGISYISYPFSINGVWYRDDLGMTIPYERFYQTMKEGAETGTAQINASEFETYFEPFLKEGKDILHLCLSSGITGVINSARIAKENLEARYPGRKIYLTDSLAASSGYGLLMNRLADLRDEGMELEELYRWTEENKLRIHHWFFSTDLSFYIRGGRIPKTAGTIGQLLGICPLLNVSAEGKLTLREKIRSKKRVIGVMVDKMERYADNGTDYADKCYLSHSACLEDAEDMAVLIEERFPYLAGKTEINSIGSTIGSHTGPGTVTLFFWGQKRTD